MRSLLNSKVTITLLIFPLLKPSYFITIPFLDSAFDYAKVGAFLAIAFLYFLYVLHAGISKIVLLCLAFQLSLFTSTFLFGGNYWAFMTSGFAHLGICLLFDMCIRNNSLILFKVVRFFLTLLSIVNLITIFAFPKGMYTTQYTANWLLGYRNLHIVVLLPNICFCMLCSYYQKGKLDLCTIFNLAVACITVFSTWSATSITGMFMMAIFVLFLSKRNSKLSYLLNFNTYVIIIVFLFLFFIVFRMQEILSGIIVVVLKRSTTFTSRVGIWDDAIRYIRESPIWGNGWEPEELIRAKLRLSHAHNHFLNVAYLGGIVALVIFVWMILLPGKKLKQHQHNDSANVIAFTVFTFLVMMLFEYYSSGYLFHGLLVIAYHVDKVIDQCESHEALGIKRKAVDRRKLTYDLSETLKYGTLLNPSEEGP